MKSAAVRQFNPAWDVKPMFTADELYRLQLALESKISDDIAYIRIVQDEIKTNRNHHDNRYLEEGKEILQKDLDLKEKIIELRYRR